MDVVSKEVVNITKNEEAIIDDIEKNNFYKILNTYRFPRKDLEVIFQSEIYTNNIQEELNIVLRKLKKEHGISITDSVLFLDEFTKVKKILIFLDGESKFILKNELSEKHGIEIETNDLYKILG